MKKTKCPLFIFLVILHILTATILRDLTPLTQSCTQLKAPGVKIICVLYLRYNVAFTFK